MFRYTSKSRVLHWVRLLTARFTGIATILDGGVDHEQMVFLRNDDPTSVFSHICKEGTASDGGQSCFGILAERIVQSQLALVRERGNLASLRGGSRDKVEFAGVGLALGLDDLVARGQTRVNAVDGVVRVADEGLLRCELSELGLGKEVDNVSAVELHGIGHSASLKIEGVGDFRVERVAEQHLGVLVVEHDLLWVDRAGAVRGGEALNGSGELKLLSARALLPEDANHVASNDKGEVFFVSNCKLRVLCVELALAKCLAFIFIFVL